MHISLLWQGAAKLRPDDIAAVDGWTRTARTQTQ